MKRPKHTRKDVLSVRLRSSNCKFSRGFAIGCGDGFESFAGKRSQPLGVNPQQFSGSSQLYPASCPIEKSDTDFFF